MFCGIVSRIRGALSAELVIFLLGVMGNHYGAIWYGFEFPLLPPLRKGLPPLSIRHRSSQTKRLMMVLGNQSLMPRTSGRLQKLNVGQEGPASLANPSWPIFYQLFLSGFMVGAAVRDGYAHQDNKMQ